MKERKKLKNNLTKPQDSTFVIYEVADKSPEYYKGEEALTEFILENIEYPNVAKNQNIEGTVQLTFVVETNGFVSNIKAIKQVNGGCTAEAIRVVGLLKWKPAEKNGKYIRYKVTYPITFNLKNINKDNSSSQQ
jgi:protein TonB